MPKPTRKHYVVGFLHFIQYKSLKGWTTYVLYLYTVYDCLLVEIKKNAAHGIHGSAVLPGGPQLPQCLPLLYDRSMIHITTP
jgi:hypothetical protein